MRLWLWPVLIQPQVPVRRQVESRNSVGNILTHHQFTGQGTHTVTDQILLLRFTVVPCKTSGRQAQGSVTPDSSDLVAFHVDYLRR